MKKLLSFLLVLSSLVATAQVSRDQLQLNNSIGINFKNLGARERLFVPLDTLNTNGDSAYLAFVHGRWYGRGSSKWVDLGALKVNDTTYIILGDTVKVSAGGLAAIDSAYNGLSRNGTKVQLGQDSSQPGNPAALQSSREIPFNGFNVHFSGLGYLKAGTNAGTSTARMQINAASSFAKTPYLAMGPLLSNSIYATLHTSDTVTTANLASQFPRALQINRNLIIGQNGNIDIGGLSATSISNILRLRDTVTLNASGHNNWYSNYAGLSFLKAGGYSGRSAIRGGVDGQYDAPTVFVSEFVVGGSSGANNFHFYGDWAGITSELAQVASVQDTIDHFTHFYANSSFEGRVLKGEYYRGDSLARSSDSLWSWYFNEPEAMGYHQGRLGIGIRVPLYHLHVNGTMAVNKDSIENVSSITTQSVLLQDTLTGKFKRGPLSFFGGGGGSGNKSMVPRYRIAIGILGDTIGSSSMLRYVDSVKQLSAPYINAFNSLTAGSAWYNAKPTKFDVLFGNSITAKTIAQKYLAYSSRLCNMSNTLEINFGIGGTRMVSLTPGDSAMSERTFLIATYNSSVHNNLYFGYGTNDWRTGSVDSATFRSTYNTVIDAAVAKGWPLDHIILVSAGYSITANTSLQHRNKEFVDITLDLGRKKGVKVVDVYTTMITNGGILGLQADSVHLNEFGNELWALAISDTLGLKVGDVRAGAYMYARQINIKQYLNHPALSIEDSNGVAYAEVRGWHGVGSFDASMSIGLDAMDSLTTGTNDYAYGQESLRGITTGIGNNAYGFNTINKNKTGNYNSAFGHNSLSKITGTRNTAVGAFALQNATAVNDLTAGGYGALQNNSTGINNSAWGASALNANTTANNSTAAGTNAAVAQTTGGNNSVFGTNAAFTNQTGSNNALFGYQSGFTFNGGVGNSAFGSNSLRLGTTSMSLNAAFGFGALEQATSSSRNSAFGASGMKLVTSGGNNTGIGYAHGDSITTGVENFFGGYQSAFNLQGAASRNIFLGSNSGLNWRLGNDNIVIGQYVVPANTNWSKKVIISQDGDTAALVIDSNLNVGIGVLNPTAKLDIDGNLRIRSVTTGTQATDSGLVISNGVVKAVKAQVATDGVFTPTLTNTTNVSASAAYPGQWSRNGNTVTMSGEVDIDPTAGATLTVLTMTIPVASTLPNSYNLSGTASNDDVIGNTARVKSNGAGAAVISFIPNSLANLRYSYIYQYTIN